VRSEETHLSLFGLPRLEASLRGLIEKSVIIIEAPSGFGKTVQAQKLEWAEYRRKRADGDYADSGEEVQISQYKYSSFQQI